MHRIKDEKPRRDRMNKTMTFFNKAASPKPYNETDNQLVLNNWNKDYAKSVGRQRQTSDILKPTKTQVTSNLFKASRGTTYLTAPMNKFN